MSEKKESLFVKPDRTPRGEWIAVGITAVPYAVLIPCLFLPIPFERLTLICGGVLFWSSVTWGGYMMSKTVINWKGLSVQMERSKNGKSLDNTLPEKEVMKDVSRRQDREGCGE